MPFILCLLVMIFLMLILGSVAAMSIAAAVAYNFWLGGSATLVAALLLSKLANLFIDLLDWIVSGR